MEDNPNKLKEHFKRHRTKYLCVGTAVLSAGLTWFIMRRNCLQHIGTGNVAVTAKRGSVAVLADRSVVTNNVSYISSRRQGSPSWVVRCIETGEIFPSQLKAANLMNIPQSEISQQLNGIRDTARGRTFERICMAA